MVVSKKSVYLFSFLLAFCSLFYELVYAHILSVCVGGTKTQYLLIISLFTCALGFGSLLQGYFKKHFELRSLFFTIEFSLIILGSLGPFAITWLLQVENEAQVLSMLKLFICYFLVFIIGLLSGFEIPCLFDMGHSDQGKILAFDYGGMLVASLLFPFFFLPHLGTAAATLIVASLNLHALIWLSPLSIAPKTKKIFHMIVVLIILGVFAGRRELNTILSSLYLGGA